MILCPSKARQMGLCNIDERLLHAKYALTVHPAPRGSVSVSCQVLLFMTEQVPHAATIWEPLPTIDKTSDFTCSVTRVTPQDGEFELDLAFIGDADDEQLIRDYLLSVTIDYDVASSLLSWMPLVTRNVRSDVGVGDLCLLAYHIGRHPPPGTAESEDPLGTFRGCWGAMSWERQVLGIPLEPSCRFIASSYVTVHVVDANGKPIQNVTVVLYGTFCQYIDDGAWRGNNLLATSDSDGNARFEVIPYVRYNVTIGDVVLSEITGPPPTVSTTITVILAQTPYLILAVSHLPPLTLKVESTNGIHYQFLAAASSWRREDSSFHPLLNLKM
jgi:hypothetical protein